MLRYLFVGLTIMSLAACGRNTPPQGELDLESLRGQWLVINYWAQWCKPCIHEIPELNALDRRYPEVTVFGVNYDGATGEELAVQVGKLGMEFPNLTTDPSGTLGIDRPVVLPTTVIIDPQGTLRDILVGPQTLRSLAEATGQQAP
jgi:thiol-disulfide isomerase/thioredoxin